MRWEHWVYTVPLRLRSVFRREHVEQELDDEVRFHVERQIAENIARGSTPEQAREAAHRAMIGIEQRKEECRDARRVSAVDELRRNVGFGLRRIRRTPGLTSAVILTLALGIGATTTVFTALNTLVLRPLPVEAGDRLVSFNHGEAVSFSYPDYQDFRDRNDVLSGLMAYRAVPMNLATQVTGNVRIWGYEATGNYFDLLGVRPLLGRLLRPDDDDHPGAHPVIVLSYDCWQRRFLGDPNVVNRAVKINGLTYTVLGVTPAGFRGTELILSPDVWVPMSMAGQIEPGERWLDSRSTTNVWMLGRLKAGVSRMQAEASLNPIAKQLAREYPSTAEGMTIELSTPGLVGKALRGPITAFAGVLMGVAALVLLLACFNLAGMLVASAADRRKEIAVRLALGASRAQLVRQLLTESLLLAVTGATAGLLVSTWLAGLFSTWQPPFDLPINTTLVIDARVVLFAVASALFATLLFGLVPALQATRPSLVPALKDAAVVERVRRWHIRDLLVAAQIMLSVMLLIASLLMIRSLQRALHLDLGFDPEHAVSVSFDLGLEGYSEARGRAFQQQVHERVAALAGVSAAGLIDYMPLRVGNSVDNVSIVGGSTPPRDERVTAVLYSVSAGYFAAAGTQRLAGRAIDTHDRAGSLPVAVVNETFVRRLLGREQPIGKRLRFGHPPAGNTIEIVGVVEDGKYQSLGEDPTPAVYSPMAQRYNGWTTLVVRSSLPPERTVQLIRTAMLDLDPALTLFNVGTLKDQLAFPLFPVRVAASVLGVFGLLAIVLSSTGVFALVAHAVSRRTREIGIRMALGAGWRQVLGAVLGRTIIVWVIGSLLGSIIALTGSQAMSAILYDVSPRDPIAYVSALLLTGAVAILACLSPARRAMRVNPVETVRQE
jgi:macrolide transport system ATP-binding/permease protein